LPGVESAAIGVNVPFDDSEWDSSFHLTGTPKPPPGEKSPQPEVNVVRPAIFISWECRFFADGILARRTDQEIRDL
jgi:hypothetical protein